MRRLLFILMCLCLVSPLLAENVLVNPGFETGDTTGWGARFGVGSVEAITENPSPHSGTYCGRDYGRTSNWNGIWQSQNMREVTELAVVYPVSVYVRTNTAEGVTVAMTMQYEPEAGTVYDQIANTTADDSGWVLLEGEYEMLDNDSTTATFYIETTGGTGSDTAEIYVDDAAFGSNDKADGKPYDPVVGPDPLETGFPGTPVDTGGQVWKIFDIVLGWKAGIDPNEIYAVNPNIVKHNIYLQTDLPADPNFFYIGSVDQVSLVDPNQSFALADADPAVVLEQGTTYQWQVEQVILDPNGVAYPDGDPDNIWGSIWSFTTANAVPSITSITDHMLLDSNGDTSFTIATTASADNFRWYKVVGEVDSDDNGETDDVEIDGTTDGGIYSDFETKTLVVTGAAADGSQDALIYAKAFNGVPGAEGSEPSEPSAARWFWAPNLKSYYSFESVTNDGNDVTPDSVSGYGMVLLSNDTGEDVPSLEPNVPSAPGIVGNGNSLLFDNPRIGDPNSADAQYGQVFAPWAAGYKDLTISAWIYNKGGSNWNRILDYGNNTNNYTFLCVNPGSVNNAVRFAVKVTGTEQTVTTAAGALPVNEWTYVSATLTESTARIYINGELAATSTTLTNNPVNYGTTVNNWLGRSQWGGGDGYFNGLLDELKIYNYARTSVDVGQDYLADTQEEYVCNLEVYDLENYDTNENCLLDLPDFASMAARWLEDDRIYPLP